ncbi:MAG: hypothetical protein GY847_00580 [Proteobacteria bacterium]|nr:hypothetical protein [Pseudomonadota bacterium]
MSKQRIIHLSDLHFRGRKKERDFVDRIIGCIARHYPKTPVIITGDVTDSATREQMLEARSALDKLATTNPVLIAPGNHDYAWKGNVCRDSGWKNWVQVLGEPLGWPKKRPGWMEKACKPIGTRGLGVWESGRCVYFGIDSGDPEDKVKSAKGFISKKLAEALTHTLKQYTHKTRIAFLHHHPFTDGLFTKLEGSKRLMSALKGNCELLLFGHEHEYGIWWNKGGIPLTVSSHKSTDRVLGGQLMITVIEIDKVGTSSPSFWHRLELL